MPDLNEKESSSVTRIVGDDEVNVLKIDEHKAAWIKIIGNDGLYQAFVDAAGRIAVNANITTPEAVYLLDPVKLNGTGSSDMNVDGTTNKVFRFLPPAGNIWYVESLTLSMEDNTNGETTTNFGALAVLTNGLQINLKTKGQTFTITNVVSNAELTARFPMDSILERRSIALGTIIYFKGTMPFTSRLVLDPNLGDYIEVVVRDNLTGLTFLKTLVKAWRLIG